MPLVNIRVALETALKGIAPTLLTAYENVSFTPVIGEPFQAAYLMQANPQNPTLGDSFYRAVGIFQINLMYPIQGGPAAAIARAEMIQSTFARGNTFSNGGVTVRIITTPSIGAGTVVGDRFQVPVKIPYSADIFS